jgi:hypothetical protein
MVADFLKPAGFVFDKGLPPRFRKIKDKHVFEVFFNFVDSGFSAFSRMLITHLKVEEIIMEVGIPTNRFEAQKKGEEFLWTVHDKENQLAYDANKQGLKTEADAEAFGRAAVEYLDQSGLAFAEKYSSLPNVLARMEELEKEGKYWKDILAGGPEYFFRGLIISKLCEDPDYERKLTYADELFLPNTSEKWKPYYAQLKAKLKNL